MNAIATTALERATLAYDKAARASKRAHDGLRTIRSETLEIIDREVLITRYAMQAIKAAADAA